MEHVLLKHKGSCHCGAVQWEVMAPDQVTALRCNCSICEKKQNIHIIVPASRFKLVKGHDDITTYTFNTLTAKHTFCKICGVQSFYTPRSNADGIAIMPHCIDGGTLKKIHVRDVNGANWEKSVADDPDIARMSRK